MFELLMGNVQSVAECQQGQTGTVVAEVPVNELIQGESTEDPGSEATNDEEAESPVDENANDDDETTHTTENPAEEKKTIVLQTAPIDPRFPGANASRYCYVAYNEYHKCIQERGKDARECDVKAKTYRSICPSEWIASWNELRENGTWFGKY